jgi:hypothetical protein
MKVRPSSLLLACAVLLSASSPAPAQPVGNKKKALELWDKAKVQYDLGHWPQAIELWVQAYETFNAPEFLFNIGQAYRQDGNCERALFFYRRYLAARPNAKNRGEVETFIKDLQETCKAPGAPPPKPGGKPEPAVPGKNAPGVKTAPGGKPVSGVRPSSAGPAVKSGPASAPGHAAVADAGDGDEGDTEDEGDTGDGEVAGGVEPGAERPALFAARAAAGPSFASFGNLEVGTLATFDLSAGHPIDVGPVVIEPGVHIGYLPVPWESTSVADATGTAGLTSLLANVGVSRHIQSGFSLRGELGLGAVLFSGLTEPGNPFLDEMDMADGTIPLFNARVALGAEYAVTRNFLVQLQPVVFSYSPSSPLREDIEKITRFEILLGAGFQM